MCPGVSVEIHEIVQVTRTGTASAVAAKLKTADVVFTNAAEEMRSLVPLERLSGAGVRTISFPAIEFTGFQPDMARLIDSSAKPTAGPLCPCHSLIIAASYSLGFSPQRTALLFNSYVYASLGYFAEFGPARRALLSKASSLGYDLSESFAQWLREGSFMHTINHPHIRVLGTLAAMAAQKAGFQADVALCESPGDSLALSFCWPVYPELAERLSVDGGLSFERNAFLARQLNVSRRLSLEEFITQSFAAYAVGGQDLVALSTRVAHTASVLRVICARS